tara:strand:+ start:2411 stop:2887 length:477 start_codon:yes stop_codon:yes gene_type:complete
MFYKFQIHFYAVILLFSLFTIISALYIEHILLIPACKLCLYQRIPYILSVIICFFGFYFSEKKIWLYLLIITFSSSIIISGYHLGIENAVFAEFSGCTNENLDTIDKSKLLESLSNALPDCKNVNFRIFGFSLATINFIISIALLVITIKYLRDEKNR